MSALEVWLDAQGDDSAAETLCRLLRADDDRVVVAALAAVYFGEVREPDLPVLCEAMAEGDRLVPPTLSCGKHSTGGVGDALTLVVGPLLAACGVAAPKFSGGRLGHCAGTTDRLRSFGIDPVLSRPDMDRLLKDHGWFAASIGKSFATGDRRLYGLRDLCGLVENADLIACSIMSKKVAEGVPNLVIDMPVGPGGLVATADAAGVLTRKLLQLADHFELATAILWRDASSPLSNGVGAGAEAREAVRALRGESPRVARDALAVVAAALNLAGVAGCDPGNVLETGVPLERLRSYVSELGLSELLDACPPHETAVPCPTTGVLAAIDPAALGWVAARLEADERHLPGQPGIRLECSVGERVDGGEVVATIESCAEPGSGVLEAVRAAFVIVDDPGVVGAERVAPQTHLSKLARAPLPGGDHVVVEVRCA